MKIIDISKHNGTIDWKRVKADGVEGVIIRAGFGSLITQKDSKFEENYLGAKAVGLNVGAYWYSYASTADEAAKEAVVFLECIKGKTFEMPVYFDIEDKIHTKLSKEVCTAITTAFMSKMEKAGYFAGVYSYDSFFKSNLDESIQTRYALWVARVENITPVYCKGWGMHQYSWLGKIDGINGSVDINNCIKDYPTLIKAKGFNGCTETKKFKVTAEINGLSAEKASAVSNECVNMGMTSAITAES